VSAGRLTVQWLGPVAVVTMPAEIDVSNAAAIRERLLLLLNQGASVLVVDMTATTFCDCTGAGAVMRAYRRASAAGAQVRLVSGGPLVRRIFGLLGIGRVIDMYPSVAAAVAGRTDPRRARPSDTPAQGRDQVPNGGG
jgi:anti-sigma B factor antagonist